MKVGKDYINRMDSKLAKKKKICNKSGGESVNKETGQLSVRVGIVLNDSKMKG